MGNKNAHTNEEPPSFQQPFCWPISPQFAFSIAPQKESMISMDFTGRMPWLSPYRRRQSTEGHFKAVTPTSGLALSSLDPSPDSLVSICPDNAKNPMIKPVQCTPTIPERQCMLRVQNTVAVSLNWLTVVAFVAGSDCSLHGNSRPSYQHTQTYCVTN